VTLGARTLKPVRGAVAHAASVSGKPVLIVEDDLDTRDALVTLLQSEGYSTIVADDGARALDLLQQEVRPCLILLDYHMPVMDGLGFRERQAADPKLADIPVVLYSGAYDIRRMADALAIPHVFQKPLNLNDLVDLVHRYC
jgi:CheY-like chemotaxis protein